jgi:hypothetical protein
VEVGGVEVGGFFVVVTGGDVVTMGVSVTGVTGGGVTAVGGGRVTTGVALGSMIIKGGKII